MLYWCCCVMCVCCSVGIGVVRNCWAQLPTGMLYCGTLPREKLTFRSVFLLRSCKFSSILEIGEMMSVRKQMLFFYTFWYSWYLNIILYTCVAQHGGGRKLWLILLNSAKYYTPFRWSNALVVWCFDKEKESSLQFSEVFLSPMFSYMYASTPWKNDQYNVILAM